MNREIKFRAWDKNQKKIYTVVGLDFAEMNVIYGEYTDWEIHSLKNVILMQFTGLHDKNGKEIYDGDIVRAYKPNCYLDGVYEVRWNKSEGAWRYWKEEGPYFMFSVQSKMYNVGNNKGGAWCEVIGNIWENPELLKEEQTQ